MIDQALGRHLLFNRLNSLASMKKKNEAGIKTPKWKGRLYAAGAVIVGLLMRLTTPALSQLVSPLFSEHSKLLEAFSELLFGLSEALMIAGVLALLVDPFLKAEIIGDVARGLWVYMIGYEHQPEIQQRLEAIAFNTKIYRYDYRLRVRIESLNKEETRLNVALDYKIKNVSTGPAEYLFRISCNKYERGSVKRMSMMSVQDSGVSKRAGKMRPYEGSDADTDGEYQCLKAVKLKKNVEYRCYGEYSMTFPRDHFFVMNMSHPTIGITLDIEYPENCKVFADQTEHQTETQWIYDKLFMTSEHFAIHWTFDPNS
jgi:hypothetical protein